MKSFLLTVTSLLILSSCSFESREDKGKSRPQDLKLKQLEWLVGSWANISEESRFYETWTRANDSVFSAYSYMTISGDTVFSEIAAIELIGDKLFYIVTASGQNDSLPVSFRLISTSNGEFIFENKEHDFPQRIIYKNPAPDSLYARIEGMINGKFSMQDFPMKRNFE